MCYVVVRRDPLFDLVPLVDVFRVEYANISVLLGNIATLFIFS